jgi:predicted DNA-binding protein (MmcQ/YjbR family)
MAKRRATSSASNKLRAFGLRYPGAHLKSPWPGHLDLAVKDKTFAYLSVEGAPFKISCKLPHTSALALALPFTEPAAYGLGRSGWVTAKVPDGEVVPLELFQAWIDESYRAQAPKKLVQSLDGDAAKPAAPRAKRGVTRKKGGDRARGARSAQTRPRQRAR